MIFHLIEINIKQIPEIVYNILKKRSPIYISNSSKIVIIIIYDIYNFHYLSQYYMKSKLIFK